MVAAAAGVTNSKTPSAAAGRRMGATRAGGRTKLHGPGLRRLALGALLLQLGATRRQLALQPVHFGLQRRRRRTRAALALR